MLARNDTHVVSACVASVKAQDYPALDLLVSDNASTDSTADVVEKEHPDVELWRNSENTGYAGGHNKAASRGGYDAFLALNADIVLEPDFVSRLVEAAFSHPGCGMATGLLFRTDTPELVDSAGVWIDRFRRNHEVGSGKPPGPTLSGRVEVFGAFGAAALFKKSMIQDLAPYNDGHLFDPDFFAFREEVDLAYRARMRGWTCLLEPRAKAIHEHRYRPETRDRRPAFERRLQRRNRYLLLFKNEPLKCLLRDLPFIACFEVAAFLHALLVEPEVLGAYGEALELLPRMLEKRRRLRAFRTVSDRQLCRWIGRGPTSG